VDSVNGIGATQSDVFRFRYGKDGFGGMGRVLWTPPAPRAGEQAEVIYIPEGGPLEAMSPITAHRGFTFNGNDWQSVTGLTMTQQGDGSFSLNVTIPDNAEAINLAFNHQGTTWDNNSGNDWTIPVLPKEETPSPSMFIIY